MTITLGLILGIIALVAGILMLVGGRWSGYPLAAIAIIALSLLVVLPALGVNVYSRPTRGLSPARLV